MGRRAEGARGTSLASARLVGAIVVGAVMAAAAARAQETLPEIQVIGTSPLQGVGIDRDKVPAMTQTVTADDFSRAYSPNITDTLFQRIPGVTLSDPNGNSVQQEIRYRGFAASPLQGTPQGLAVYMNGIRINEAFGDTVNWDLIPTNAIQRADVYTNNPVFGLNALGGAISLQMKNGFNYQGFEIEGSGGSYGRLNGAVQYGVQKGDWSAYFAAQGMNDDGWRLKSGAELARVYMDVGYRTDVSEWHLIASAAHNSFGVAAATPIQLLQQNWNSVYTTPQTTQNDMGLVALNGKYALTDTWSLQDNIYSRWFKQQHVDGNAGDFERCSASSSFANQLCLEDDSFNSLRPVPFTGAAALAFRNQFVVLTPNNTTIPCPPGAGNTCNSTPYGTIDRTNTQSATEGASLQATNTDKIFGHENQFIVGGSIDHGRTMFNANSTLGYIFPDLTVGNNPAIPGNGSVVHTLGNLGYSPVDLNAYNTYYGLYASDTFNVTERFAVTGGARLNIAQIKVTDLLGTSPELNSNPTYTRLNPMVGATYKIAPWMTAYAGYSESNRAPTPLELGCSSSTHPCLLENFLVADPPLKQVVGHTYEAGLRGETAVWDGKFTWKAGLFRTDSDNDIINVASALASRGFFTNVPETRRQGVEIGTEYKSAQWLVYANYSFIDATYQFTGDLSSPNNPMADANGNVHVTPGDHIPGIPQHQIKVGAEYLVTPQWKIGADVSWVGSQYFVGDDANQNTKLPAYWVANLHSSYDVNKDVTVFLVVNNLFDKKYALFGTYFDPSDVQNVKLPIVLTDQRTEVPGQPFVIYGGFKVRL